MADPRAPSISRALTAALKAVPTRDEDRSAVALAKRYAACLDDAKGLPDVLGKIGPLFLAALVELRLTPKARIDVARGGALPSDGTAAAALAKLRGQRAGANGAAPVDTAAA